VFARAFCNFNIARLAKQDPPRLLKKYWPYLSHMRFRGKVGSMVKCAQILEDIRREHGSFARLLKHHQIPQRIRTEKEFNRFWIGSVPFRKDGRVPRK
jgi:3-methyladenine DNA glycosylase Tag